MSQPQSNGMAPAGPDRTGGQPAATTAAAPTAATAAAAPTAATAAAQTTPGAKKKTADTYNKDCAVLAGPSGPVIAAGSILGAPVRIRSRLVMLTNPPVNPWMGFSLFFPLGNEQKGNEAAGFGVRYISDPASEGGLTQTDWHNVVFRLPRGGFVATMEDPTPTISALFPSAKRLTLVSIRLLNGARVSIRGFGLPFANADDPDVEGWVNHDKPIVEGTTLLDLVRRTEFHLVVPGPRAEVEKRWSEDRLPDPFSYPYGIAQGWDFNRYEALIRENKSNVPFRAAHAFDDDNAHLTVRCQSVVQDVVWLQQAVVAMSQLSFPVYFVNRGADDRRYYAVIPLTTEFRDRFEAAWSKLAKDDEVSLLLEAGEGKKPVKWDCTIVNHPRAFAELQPHPTEEHELVVMASRPAAGQKGHDLQVKTFGDRTEANRAYKESADH
ncbi:hypothetical protein B0I37DRAFT_441680 [Chaetomium sp. MPI-CAGE-AT-0009]|nr:hypothetical protein B0I37DRAFT_441680 [Chaetomium sp. MPI-CAGE-AT-0009]